MPLTTSPPPPAFWGTVPNDPCRLSRGRRSPLLAIRDAETGGIIVRPNTTGRNVVLNSRLTWPSVWLSSIRRFQ